MGRGGSCVRAVYPGLLAPVWAVSLEINVHMPTGRGSQLDVHLPCDGNIHVLDTYWFSVRPSPAGLQCSKAVPATLLGLSFASC